MHMKRRTGAGRPPRCGCAQEEEEEGIRHEKAELDGGVYWLGGIFWRACVGYAAYKFI